MSAFLLGVAAGLLVVAALRAATPTPARGRRPMPSGHHRRRPTRRRTTAGGVPLAPWTALRHVRAARRDDTRRTMEDELPDLIDLLVLATSAGLSVPAAMPRIAPWCPPSLRPGLDTATTAMARGTVAHLAVAHLVDVDTDNAWGDAGRPLVHAINDHLVHGTPLAPALHRVAADARARRRRAAQTRARRLPILLLFPLVTCTLPAFGLLTVAPIVVSTLQSLDGKTLEATASDPRQPEVSPCPMPFCPSPFTSPR